MNHEKQDEPRSDVSKELRTYEAPRIVESAAFERLALACAHAPGTTPTCIATPNVSGL